MIVTEEKREESNGRDGLTVTRTLRVQPYSQRQTVMDALLGYVAMFGGQLVRVPPARDPWYPWCFCTEAKATHVEVLNSPEYSTSGLSILAATNYAESARIVATYKTLDYDEQSEQNSSPNSDSEKELASESWDFGYTLQRQSGRYWTDNNGTDKIMLAQAGLEFSLTYGKVDYHLMRHFCIKKPVQAMLKLFNRVNYEPFTVGDVTWPVETVRYEGSHVSRKRTNKGQGYHEIDHKFAIFPHYDFVDGKVTKDYVGWNRIWMPHLGWWGRPKLAANQNDPPELKDRPPFLWDIDIQQTLGSSLVKGFDLLFHPRAT